MEAQKTQLMIAIERQRVVEKEEETERKRAVISAQRKAEVSAIAKQQEIAEQEAAQNVSAIKDAMHLAKERAVADANAYRLKVRQSDPAKLVCECVCVCVCVCVCARARLFLDRRGWVAAARARTPRACAGDARRHLQMEAEANAALLTPQYLELVRPAPRPRASQHTALLTLRSRYAFNAPARRCAGALSARSGAAGPRAGGRQQHQGVLRQQHPDHVQRGGRRREALRPRERKRAFTDNSHQKARRARGGWWKI
jgi:hypothetical protein